MAGRKWIATLVVVVALWMGGYAFVSRDPDATAYRELCVQSAQSALDGLSTVRLSTDRGAVVARRPWGRLLGYEREQATGPWLLQAFARLVMHRRVRVFDWVDLDHNR